MICQGKGGFAKKPLPKPGDMEGRREKGHVWGVGRIGIEQAGATAPGKGGHKNDQ